MAMQCNENNCQFPHQQVTLPASFADSARSKSLRLLGLSHSVTLTSAVLQEAFRRCALTWHPDRHSGAAKRAAEEKFKEVQAAYQLLKASCPA